MNQLFQPFICCSQTASNKKVLFADIEVSMKHQTYLHVTEYLELVSAQGLGKEKISIRIKNFIFYVPASNIS